MIDKNLETWIVTICYLSFTILLLKEVIFRYFFSQASDWIEEIARYLFVFLVYFAAAHAIKVRGHLRINIIDNFISEKVKVYLNILYDICFLILAVIIIIFSLKIMQVQIRMETLASSASLREIGLNMAFVYAAIPLGWGLIVFRIIQRFIITLVNFNKSSNLGDCKSSETK